MLKKLRIKFVCITMGIATAMLCVILGMVIHFTAAAMEEQSIRVMRSVAPFHNGPEKRPEGPRLPYFAIVRDRSGELQVEGGYEGMADLTQMPEILSAAQAQQGQTGVLKSHSLRFWKAPGPGGERIVFVDISSEQETMKNLVYSCIIIGLICFFLFLGISILLAKWAIAPVEQAWQQQKQFVTDASHELKTPLTVILTNAELLQGGDCTEPEARQFSDSILTMSRQMRSLVEGLLELARVDNGAVKTAFSQVDMTALVCDGMLPFEPLFFEKGLELSSDVEPGVALGGSGQHLRQVLDILLDNAMKYSAPGGTVHVRLQRQNSQCILSVASPGAALSRKEQKEIFKRFYRVDKARSRDGSYGLGLSIAQRIVEEHRGKIWAESADGRNTFFVQLPANGHAGR